MQRKSSTLQGGQGRSQIQAHRNQHIANEAQLRNPQSYPIQAVMMQGRSSFIQGHPMTVQRAMRPSRPAMYSSSPQGPHSQMHQYMQQGNMQYQVVSQEPYNVQPMMRHAYISPNIQQFQMQPTSAPFQPTQFIQQSPPFYAQGMHPMYYAVPPQPSQPQPPQQQTPTLNPTIQSNTVAKPKPKRTSRIIIKDPSKDNKDVTNEILAQGSQANGRHGGTPPLLNSTAQISSESSTIQAQFAAQVAARVGERGKQPVDEKVEYQEKNDKEAQTKKTDLAEETKKEELHENKQGNGYIVTENNYTDKSQERNTDSLTKETSLQDLDRTETPKDTPDETQLNQSSPTLGEMTEKMKMTMEPNVKLLQADKETMNDGAKEIKAIRVINGESSENIVEVKTVDENMVSHNADEEKKADDSHMTDKGVDSNENGIEDMKSLETDAQSSVIPDKTEMSIDANSTDTKQVVSNKAVLSKEEESKPQEQDSKPIDNLKELPSLFVGKQQEKSEPESEQEIEQQQIDKQQSKQQQEDKEQQPAEKEQQKQDDKQQQKPDNPKPQDKQLQQPHKTSEPPKKKSSKQRLKDLNKKETGGDLMDAYTDKPPPQEPVVEEKVIPVEIIPEQVNKPLEEDLSWEDKGEKIGDEIKVEKENDTEAAAPVEQTKRKYERDFLLQFQYMQMCTEKPAGLPNIEVVLDAPVPPSKGGASQRGGADFMPSFARQKSQGGGGRRDNRGKPPPRKIIAAAPQPPVVLKQSENRWQRPQEKENELSEDEKKTAELYRTVVAILNKLTPQKFKTLVEQIMALNIDTTARLEGVIDRIFEKAISEPVFSVAYANMCRCLFTIKVIDPEGKDVSFRKLLLNRCQKEFEKEKEDEKALEKKYNQLEGLSEEEKKLKKEEMDEVLANNKRRMLGNIKFIGELFKLKLLTENIMHDCIFKLLRSGDEESLESMCKLLFTIGKDLDSDKAKPRIEQYFDQINKIIVGKKASSRVTFMLRDVVDLRKNNWVGRREEQYNPKTIDQIHKEAHMEKMEEKRMAAQMPKDNKQKKSGGQGGRDSPKPTSSDGWVTPGRGGKVTIDHNKFKSMAKRANNEEGISLGPSSRFGQWGRGSSAGLSSTSSQEQEPQGGNRFSALSGGDMSMPSNRPYDPRAGRSSSAGGRPSSAGFRGTDKRNTKSDRDSALEAVRALNKPQNEKPQITQPQPPAQEKPEVKVVKEPKDPVKEPLSEEELRKKTSAIIDEYVNIQDLQEAITCFTELHSPTLHHLFISTAVEHTYEMTSRARHATGRLFGELLAQNKLSREQLTAGFDIVLEFADDYAIDYPMLWKYIAEIITPVILRDLFSISHLKPLILKHLIPCQKAAVLLAEILLIGKDLAGENKAIQIWSDAGISWSEVLPVHLTKEEFISRKNLNFLPSGYNELLKLLHADQFKNDIVFAHIEKNFKEEKRKEAQFINQLVTAVAESCIIQKDQDVGPDCCQDKLKARKDILRKYLDSNNSLELEALFALQEVYVKYNKPAAMLSQFFNILYDEEVITEEAFMTWKQDENPRRQEAKGLALQATASFFDWLQSAAIEGSEP